jgi:hypothetical protein
MNRVVPCPTPSHHGCLELLKHINRRKPAVGATVALCSSGYTVTFSRRLFGDRWNDDTQWACEEALKGAVAACNLAPVNPNQGSRGLPKVAAFDIPQCKEPYIRILTDALRAHQHVLLHGPSSAGKTAMIRWVAKDFDALHLALNTTTAAGFYAAAKEAVDRGCTVFCLEEVEKAKPVVLEALLGVMDDRRELQRVIHGRLDATPCHVTVLGTSNDLDKLVKRSSAVYSRFGLRLPCRTLDRDEAERILSLSAPASHVNAVMQYFWDRLGVRDVRTLKAALSGGARLLDGSYIHDFAVILGVYP